MNIPNLPHQMTPITTESGLMHPDWYKYFMQLTNEMQINQSQEGSVIPEQKTSDILKIQTKLNGPTLIYDSDLNVPKISVNGVFKTISTT